ncbi:hypothetical protein GUJ93_ZPchr0016g2525 [Zizania palustris]|uniref:Uncharacterized protein n=1 Tax=Zizania palustris TaxID=103762 RepID=A0A8J5TGL9_ZIZPA|nr:hypothetical protein GUJ93_ZPchr0016g2525 [Zizania palustris]
MRSPVLPPSPNRRLAISTLLASLCASLPLPVVLPLAQTPTLDVIPPSRTSPPSRAPPPSNTLPSPSRVSFRSPPPPTLSRSPSLPTAAIHVLVPAKPSTPPTQDRRPRPDSRPDTVEENEGEESIFRWFQQEVMRAGLIHEIKCRRRYENKRAQAQGQRGRPLQPPQRFLDSIFLHSLVQFSSYFRLSCACTKSQPFGFPTTYGNSEVAYASTYGSYDAYNTNQVY